jgi:DNA-binding beta-propeller fold protein YncE
LKKPYLTLPGVLAALVAAGLTLGAAPAAAPKLVPTAYHVTHTFDIGGQGSWDNWTAAAITLDDAGKHLYIPRSGEVQVIDVDTGKQVATIAVRDARAVALVPDAGRGFVTSRNDKSVTVFDLKTFAVLGKFPVADGADSIIYDPASKKVLVTCARTVVPFSPDIDPSVGKTDDPIEFEAEPRGMVADRLGMVYVVLRDTDEVAVISTRKMAVVTHFEIARWRGPTSIAIDPRHYRLFIGCRSRVAVISAVDGHDLGEVEVGSSNAWVGPGAVAFHDGQAFATCGEGNVAIIDQTPEGKFFLKSKIEVPPGARALAIDDKTSTLYLPYTETPTPQQRSTYKYPMKLAVVAKK